ncbi:MAG: response regulator [Rhodothermales bacterium]|nr:response regulator [Rhodothermales bacterium]
MRQLFFKRFLTVVCLLIAGTQTVHGQSIPSLDPDRAVTQYPLRTWVLEDGLPQLSVTAIGQSNDGYIWFGTQEGLVRFDGIEFTVYDRSNSIIPKNSIVDVLVDKDGILWLATYEAGIVRYSGPSAAVLGEQHGLADNRTSTITQLPNGEIWIGTTSAGISVYSNGRFTTISEEDGLPSNDINVILPGDSSDVWVGTESGLVRINGEVQDTLTTDDGLPSDVISALHIDKSGALWIGTDAGLARMIDLEIKVFSTKDGLPDKEIAAILEDRAGNLWIGTSLGGLCRFDGESFDRLDDRTGLGHNEINDLFQDREGTLWIGTDGGGLSQLRNGKFSSLTQKEGFAARIAFSIYEDAEKNLWMGSDGGGVSRLSDGTVTTFDRDDGLAGTHVYAISSTADGSMWFGTRDAGLIRLRDGRFKSFMNAPDLVEGGVYSLYTDSKNRMWIGGDASGISIYEDGVFRTTTPGEDYPEIFPIVFQENREGNIWIGSYKSGLFLMNGDKVLLHLDEVDGLTSNAITALHEDTDGVLWIGTGSGGLHRYKEGKLTAITTTDGLYNDTVLEILEDFQGNLWMSSNRGIFSVSKSQLNDFADGKLASVRTRPYDASDGLPSSEFNGGFQPAGWKSSDGKLWFPSTNGVVSVDPARIPVNRVKPIVIIEEVLVDGNPVSPTEGNDIGPGASRFEFGYAATTFIAPSRVKYQYQLSGVDANWINAGGHREATYTNLKPGEYVFRVRAINGDGIASASDAVVSFRLMPFFYQTRWFMAVSALVFLLVSFLVYMARVQNLKIRQRQLEKTVAERTKDLREEKEKTETALTDAQAARREAEEQTHIANESRKVIEAQADRLLEMDRIRSRFFSNLSHEFRTPLTLTIGPLENALSGVYGEVSNTMAKQMEVMLRNSRRLLRLINQLLDLSKLESGNMKIRLENGNIMNLVEGVVFSFTPFAEKEGIKLNLENKSENPSLFFDRESIEKVLFNLLSNAVKFTPENGEIRVTVEDRQAVIRGAEHDVLRIRVSDTGAGIPADQIKHIFDRFHQVDGTVSRVQEGTGIGLSLVKELVDLHAGTINVTSAIGDGTEFTITLPRDILELKAQENEEVVVDYDLGVETSHGPMVEMAVFDRDDDFADAVSTANGTAPDDAPTVMIVDDSDDIRDYVTSCLKGIYEITTARDGVDALRKIETTVPDLIVSDVMMPNMDGIELCKALKADIVYKNIPVILLTSKASMDSKIEGLEAGSDDFLAKPFNAKELRLRIASLLNIRAQARELRSLNTNLVDANEALIEASDVKTQLLNIASHDMKNPLTAIREFSRIIKEEIDNDSHLNELLDLIYSSSNEMLHLVTQLLDSAGLESGGLQLNKRPVDIGALASIVVYRNRNQAKMKEQEVIFECPEEERFMVYADADRLQEAMDNLVSNAVKYSPLGKRIWVEIDRVDGQVQFTVRDEGPGLTEDDHKKLFGKFQKLSAQPTGDESSTGLGLSIVKQIVELHEGSVWADGSDEFGTRFSFKLASYIESDQEKTSVVSEAK